MDLNKYRKAARIILETLDASTEALHRAELNGCNNEYDELIQEARLYLTDDEVLSDIHRVSMFTMAR